MNKKLLKTIKSIIIVLIICALFIAFVASQDEHHLETCHHEHCTICAIIHLAQNIISLLVTFVICTSIGFLIHIILSKMHKEKYS